MAVGSGTLGSVSNGPAVALDAGPFSLDLFGTFVGTARLERRVDGSNWVPFFYLNTAHSRTTPCSEIFNEAVPQAEYRVACTAYTSGTINWQITQQ